MCGGRAKNARGRHPVSIFWKKIQFKVQSMDYGHLITIGCTNNVWYTQPLSKGVGVSLAGVDLKWLQYYIVYNFELSNVCSWFRVLSVLCFILHSDYRHWVNTKQFYDFHFIILINLMNSGQKATFCQIFAPNKASSNSNKVSVWNPN